MKRNKFALAEADGALALTDPHHQGRDMRKRKVARISVAAALLAGGVTIGAVGPADASAMRSGATAQSCYGGAHDEEFWVSTSGGNDFWPTQGSYATTTSACADINVKPSESHSFTVCFKATGSCNGWHYAPAGQWTVVASQVLDSTKFYLQSNTHGGIAAYLAY
ncbi:hypothetical protein ABT404_05325 [Streptomyces hyaluromycini]|uniref:Uncharacterized protein n=1 Tax=Streptomyces hyaluromycini TaxID=1377993 RepID=A0ABV1WQ06_9ACTN